MPGDTESISCTGSTASATLHSVKSARLPCLSLLQVSRARELEGWIVGTRRLLHENPELSFEVPVVMGRVLEAAFPLASTTSSLKQRLPPSLTNPRYHHVASATPIPTPPSPSPTTRFYLVASASPTHGLHPCPHAPPPTFQSIPS